jgi:uncharacterized RDD family membrane protein YckC
MGVQFPPSGFTDRTAARAGVRYASWLRRFGGAVIDALLIGTINWLVVNLYVLTVGAISSAVIITYLLILIVSSTAIVYNTLCLAKLQGQTPGMRILQIRCVPFHGRRRISMPQALTRSVTGAVFTLWYPVLLLRAFLPPSVDLAIGLASVVAWFWPLIDQRRQTWWDHLAATVVLDDRGW